MWENVLHVSTDNKWLKNKRWLVSVDVSSKALTVCKTETLTLSKEKLFLESIFTKGTCKPSNIEADRTLLNSYFNIDFYMLPKFTLFCFYLSRPMLILHLCMLKCYSNIPTRSMLTCFKVCFIYIISHCTLHNLQDKTI